MQRASKRQTSLECFIGLIFVIGSETYYIYLFVSVNRSINRLLRSVTSADVTNLAAPFLSGKLHALDQSSLLVVLITFLAYNSHKVHILSVCTPICIDYSLIKLQTPRCIHFYVCIALRCPIKKKSCTSKCFFNFFIFNSEGVGGLNFRWKDTLCNSMFSHLEQVLVYSFDLSLKT